MFIDLETGNWNLESGIWNLESGAKDLPARCRRGICNLGLGIL